VLLVTTTGKWVLIVVAGLFIAWALVTAIMIPRRNEDFPLNLGAYITLTAALFVAQMAAVYWVTTYQGAEQEAAAQETTPAETTPADTRPAETTPAETTPAGGEGDVAAGKEVFASAGCGSCHTLADAGAGGAVGPNLDETKPSAELVIDRVTNGRGAMPAFKDQLDEQQIQDVAAYISSVAGA
jgi:mono/diheme cytochrome c family protein